MAIQPDRFEVRGQAGGASADSLKGYTLILPCVSIGSVPQLAVDALLQADNAERTLGERPTYVCDLDPRFCLPFVGRSSDEDRVRTPLQVYAFPRSRLAVVQQRSPVLKAHKQAFVDALGAWIGRRQFVECLLLVSADAALRTDEQLHGGPGLWTVSPMATTDEAKQSTLISAELGKRFPRYTSPSASSASYPPPLASAGLARTLLRESLNSTAAWPPTSALLAFAAEGDNRADALTMAAALLDVASSSNTTALSFEQLSEPNDWRSLFGASFEPGMF